MPSSLLSLVHPLRAAARSWGVRTERRDESAAASKVQVRLDALLDRGDVDSSPRLRWLPISMVKEAGRSGAGQKLEGAAWRPSAGRACVGRESRLVVAFAPGHEANLNGGHARLGGGRGGGATELLVVQYARNREGAVATIEHAPPDGRARPVARAEH